MGFVSRSVERLRAFAASNDGSLLDDATWASRHKRISQIAWIATAFAVVWTVADRLEAGGLFPLAMAVLLGLASRPGLGRHIRAVAVAATFVCFQIFTSRYVGNVSGLGAIYIVILTFYQDWVPIAFCCVLALGLVVFAAIDPSWLAHNRGFQREAPLTGMGLRAAAIALAAGLAFLIWRNGTQLARDPLTGILSRAGVERGLDHELAHGRRPVAWVCDVDNFATVNAELGSAAGDALLRHVAAQLRAIANRIPGGALSARLRADTFLIASNRDLGDEFVEEFARRIANEASLPAAGIANEAVPVRFSIGATRAIPGDDGAELIRRAEAAMRQAKGQGTTRVVVDLRSEHEDQPPSRGRTTSLLMSEIYRGCRDGEFDVHLQPIVRLHDLRPVGCEA